MYYYAVASLPFLEFESDLLPTVEELLSLCYLCGGESGLRIIESVKLEPDFGASADPLLKSFWRWEIGLRNELARLRAQVLNREATVYLDDTGSDCTAIAGLSDALKIIMQSTSPLETDKGIDRLRWQYLDELESGQIFNLQQMIVYYLRLQILLRRRTLVADEGRKIYQQHYATLYQQAQNGVQA